MTDSIKKRQEATRLFNEARDGATALARAKRERNNLLRWDPSSLEGTEKEIEKQVQYGKDIGGVTDYFENNFSGALEHIHKPRFRMGYHLFGDVMRQGVLGENTTTVNVDVEWELTEVVCDTYPGPIKGVHLAEKLNAINREGLGNRDDIAKFTGWNRQVVQQLPDDRINAMKQLLHEVNVGQSKLTRLVKGFLFMMDIRERGRLLIQEDVRHSILYGPTPVLDEFAKSDQAYVYNSNPGSDTHTIVLKVMSERYPPAYIQSHVAVPSDGRIVVIVNDGQQAAANPRVIMTANLVYASLLRYAEDMGITDQLQQALIIACSLRENRYFTRIGLPRVVSKVDLLVPATIRMHTNSSRPMISEEMSAALGRLHQMLAFMTCRDVITAGIRSTSTGFNGISTIRSYLSSQEGLVSRMGSYFTDLRLLDATPDFLYLSRLTDVNIYDLYELPVLEGLWLCDRASKVVDNGAIASLKLGELDVSDNTGSRDFLVQEIRKAGARVDTSLLPTGSFTVSGCNIVSLDRRPARVKSWVNFKTKPVKPCDWVPPRTSIERVKRFKKGEVATTPPPEVVVNRVAFSQPANNFQIETPMKRRLSRSVLSPPLPINVIVSDRKMRTYSSSISSSSKSGEVESSPPENQSETVLIQTRLAAEATGNMARAIGSEVGVSEADNVAKKFGWEEDSSVLKQASVDATMTKEMAALTVATEAPPHAKLPTNAELRELVLRAALQMEKVSQDDAAWVLKLMNSTDTAIIFWSVRSIAAYGEKMAARGILDFEVDVSNVTNPALIELAKAIQKGQRTIMGTELADMRKRGSKWDGEVAYADRAGLKYVGNSEPWKQFLIENDVDPDRLAAGKRMKYTLSEYYGRNVSLPLETVRTVSEWLEDTSVMSMPNDITPAELERLVIQPELDYLVNPTSMSSHDYDRADSKWLMIAAQVERQIMSFEFLMKMKKEFRVPYEMRQNLDRVYGLFASNTNTKAQFTRR